ncbi:MAG: hypothetical protein ACXVBE_14715 [Bdellovibrionota bacterium]
MHIWLLLSLLSAGLGMGESARADEPAWTRSWRGIPELTSVLGSIPEGKKILDQAKKKNSAFAEQLHMGDASFTESTFVRTYSLLDGKEKIELHHEVTLSKKLNLADAVVDLAHELIHFTDKGMLDPYRPGFALKEFVKNGIEGPGGELAALREQCKVAWALQKAYSKYPTHLLCSSYHKGQVGFDSEKAKKDYYSLGGWYSKIDIAMQHDLPELSRDRVQFNSSYAGKPYPVALAEEFHETRKAACVNNRRKYSLIAAQADSGRRPASSDLEIERRRLKQYDENFCRDLSKQTRK